ncbi:2OG-Fe(II) oxygenase family oxidoreductase [Oleiphilus messinensis]|uniref:2OG-Fe(II) oxygenase family oxidoreductase n=1 Tax=Oleiphilus messinensis TaxID=141451 RepID=A0A1Y0I726_9GAMM|nr:2OG-Fe(II) oxygenase [Oleiphilus messinensis]ARU55244.1 2OG-Fe(II) oxygenase family oxidoreductase [Oleiphilus messinensis]
MELSLSESPLLATHHPCVFETISRGLWQQGYVVLENAIPPSVFATLENNFLKLNENTFSEAGIGRGRDHTANNFVRNDKIVWLENDSELADWFDWIDTLKQELNRRLFLGLFDFECHYSIYKPGDFYKTHVDAFRGRSNRKLTMVTYFNRGWQPQDGGGLVIYGADKVTRITTVYPERNTLVLFLSEDFPHEVLTTHRDRYSLAGWFRVNNSTAEHIDPPL